MKTLVIGGTGQVGSMVVAGLLKHGVDVRVLSHSPDKLKKLPAGVESAHADLDDTKSLHGAFDKVDDLFLLCVSGPRETAEGLNAVAAAKKAGIKKIVYMSVFMPKGSEVIPLVKSKLPIETAVRDSGIPYTILRPDNFFQNDLWFKDAIMQYGVYPQPIGGTGVNRVDVRDIADGAVIALTGTGHEGRTYSLVGPDTLTGETIAHIYAKHLGREIRYGGDDLDAWEKQAKTMMPDFLVKSMRIMYQYFQDHGMIATKDDLDRLQKLLGRKPRTFDDFVKEITAIWKGEVSKAA